MRGILLLGCALVLGCSVNLREGVYSCTDDDGCPNGWVCRADQRCYRSPLTDGGNDAADMGPRPCSMPADCNDDNPCTIDSCAGVICAYANATDTTPCSDGLFCNGEETCMSGRCQPGTDPCSTIAAPCDEGNDWCQCDDGNVCTGPDRITSGICMGPPLSDARVCSGCSSPGNCGCCGGGCVNVNETTGPCGSCGNACTPPENCVPGGNPSPCGMRYCCTQ